MNTTSRNRLLFVAVLLFSLSYAIKAQTYTIDYSGIASYESISQTSVMLFDDELSAALPIGFDFTFFGNTYTEFYISSNGFITFDSASGDGCCDGQILPDTTMPNDLIALAWMDLNLAELTEYAYETVGVPGSQRLIVTFYQFDNEYDECPIVLDGQIWLYEGTDVIEMHITEFTTSCGPATQGIEDATGIEAYYDPSRNGDFSDAFDDYIAFIPDFNTAENDAGIAVLQSQYCLGDRPVIAVVENYGVNDIDSVTVNWEWEGILQTPKIFNAYTLTPGLNGIVTLDTMMFEADSTYFIRAWTSSPNGVTDTVPSNDTLSTNATAALAGTYTIGGASPDYADFASAIADLAFKSYCDTVIFNVRNGIYNEQVMIPNLNGIAGKNRVIFQSESGDSSAVTVVYNATISSDNYVLRLDDADNITIKGITFEAVDSDLGRVIEVINGSDSTEILNCHIKGYAPGSSSSSYAALFSTGSSDLRIQNSRISQGSRGISCTDQFGHPLPNNWQIIGNVIDSISQWGIYMFNVVSPDILYNEMNTYASSARCMLLSSVDEAFTIGFNRINMTSGNRAIDIFNGNASQVGEALIFNNFIYCASSSLQSVYVAGSNNIGVYHNNINHYSASSSVPVLEVNASLNINVRNNNLVNLGPGYAFSTSSLVGLSMDFNNLMTNGVSVASLNGVPHAVLADWVLASAMDSNSVSTDPFYFSASDLHVSSAALFRNGIAIPGITTDIDGDIRHLSTPDIGADEVAGFDDNIAPLVIFPQQPFASGSNPVDLIVRNLGSNIVTSFNIDWTVNGVPQSQFVFGGSLAGLASDTFNLGNVAFNSGTPYTIRTWTSMPNNAVDAQPSNDTLQVDSLYAALGGIFTIGGASPDFDSIGHAVKAMTLGGVIDTTIFLLRAGTYAEAITFTAQPGFICDRPVIFESESGDSADVVWTDANIAGVPLTLSGADGLQFKNITIQSVDGYVVYVDGESNCNRFEGCHFIGQDVTTTATSKTVVYSPGSRDTANVFINNTFEDGSYGLNWRSNTFLPYETGTIVRGNIFKGQRYRGLLLGWQEASSIIENVVTNTDIGTATYNVGIICSRCQNDMTIERNNVQLTGKSSYGIYLELCTGTASRTGLIANNFVQLGGASTANGIYVWSSSYQDVYYNSVKITGSSASSVG